MENSTRNPQPNREREMKTPEEQLTKKVSDLIAENWGSPLSQAHFTRIAVPQLVQFFQLYSDQQNKELRGAVDRREHIINIKDAEDELLAEMHDLLIQSKQYLVKAGVLDTWRIDQIITRYKNLKAK